MGGRAPSSGRHKEPSLRHSRLLLPLASKGCNYAPCKTRYVGQHSCMYYLTYTIDVIHVRRGSRIQKGGGRTFRRGGGGGSYRNVKNGSKLLQGPGQINKQKRNCRQPWGGGGGSDHPPKNPVSGLEIFIKLPVWKTSLERFSVFGPIFGCIQLYSVLRRTDQESYGWQPKYLRHWWRWWCVFWVYTNPHLYLIKNLDIGRV